MKDMSYQCALGAQIANHIPCYIKRSVTSLLREVILPLCSHETLPDVLHPVLGLQHKKGIELLERVQRRSLKMIRRLEHLPYEDRLRELGLFRLEKKRLWRNLIAALQYLKGAYRKAGEGLFIKASSNRTRGNDF